MTMNWEDEQSRPKLIQKAEELDTKLRIEFRNDPLYRIFYDDNREDELFPDFIGAIDYRKFYSTPDVAQLFGIHEQTLRNYITGLEGYVRPIRDGRLIKLNYESIFRLYMIFKLKDDYSLPKLQTMLIGSKGGTRGVTSAPIDGQKLEEITQEITQLKRFVRQVVDSGIFAMGGTPTEPKLVLNEKFLQHALSAEVVPLLEERNETLLSLEHEVESVRAQADNISNQVEKFSEVIEVHKTTNSEQLEQIKAIVDEQTARFEETTRLLKENQADKFLQKQAIAEYNKLSFFKKMSVNLVSFIEQYIEENRSKGPDGE